MMRWDESSSLWRPTTALSIVRRSANTFTTRLASRLSSIRHTHLVGCRTRADQQGKLFLVTMRTDAWTRAALLMRTRTSTSNGPAIMATALEHGSTSICQTTTMHPNEWTTSMILHDDCAGCGSLTG